MLKPDQNKSLEGYVDADFCRNWNRLTSEEDVSTAKSKTGYIITFMKFAIAWSSKIQTQIALSTTEAEYIKGSNTNHKFIK